MVVDLNRTKRENQPSGLLDGLRRAAAQNHSKILQPHQVKMAVALIDQVAGDNYSLRMQLSGAQAFLQFIEENFPEAVAAYISFVQGDEVEVELVEEAEVVEDVAAQEDAMRIAGGA